MRNAHGDVVGLTDSTGAVSKTYDYDAFGNEIAPVAGDGNPFRYCGEFWDNDAGTYYLRARNYDPTIGRFLSEDTHWNVGNMIYGDREYGEGEKKVADIRAINQALNRYAYCVSNPVNYIDRDGKAATAIAGGLLILAKIVLGVLFFVATIMTIYLIYEGVSYIVTKLENESIVYQRTKRTPPPSGLKDNKGRIKTPNTHPNEFNKNKDGSYTHKKTGWKFKKDPSDHRGPHWDATPPREREGDYQNVSPDGRIL